MPHDSDWNNIDTKISEREGGVSATSRDYIHTNNGGVEYQNHTITELEDEFKVGNQESKAVSKSRGNSRTISQMEQQFNNERTQFRLDKFKL